MHTRMKNTRNERLALIKEQEISGKPAPVICRRKKGSGCSALDTETITIDPDGHGQQPALTRILDRKRATLGRECATAILAVSGGTPEHFTNHAYDASGRIRPKDRRNPSAAGHVRTMPSSGRDGCPQPSVAKRVAMRQ